LGTFSFKVPKSAQKASATVNLEAEFYEFKSVEKMQKSVPKKFLNKKVKKHEVFQLFLLFV
jgi:hypothetical protein